jgi:hypothetical protein
VVGTQGVRDGTESTLVTAAEGRHPRERAGDGPGARTSRRVSGSGADLTIDVALFGPFDTHTGSAARHAWTGTVRTTGDDF